MELVTMTRNESKKIVKKLITNHRYKLLYFFFLVLFNCVGLICEKTGLPLLQMELFSIFFSFDMILGKKQRYPLRETNNSHHENGLHKTVINTYSRT